MHPWRGSERTVSDAKKKHICRHIHPYNHVQEKRQTHINPNTPTVNILYREFWLKMEDMMNDMPRKAEHLCA